MPRLFQAMMDAFSLPDLRRRILITLGILVIFRFIAQVPVPGVNVTALAELFQSNPLLGLLDMFSGGALQNFSVAAMGVYPYITASIIITLMQPVIPALTKLSQEGEAGRNKINLITHWLMVPMAGLQGWGQVVYLQNNGAFETGLPAFSMVTIILSMIAGTVFLVWLGELITEYGIGNGISIIIFGGIVATYPSTIGSGFAAGTNYIGLIFFLVIQLAIVALIVYFTEAHRRIPVQYARSVFRGGRMMRQGGNSHIPLRVNTAGMIPLIFAMSLVMFPGIIASYFQGNGFADGVYKLFSGTTDIPEGLVYWGLYFILTIAFAFFYTIVVFQQQDLPGTLQKQGGFVPGIRPGKNTKTYLDGVIYRITWAGALFLAIVAVTPFVAQHLTGIGNVAISSTGLLIVVGVVLDTMKQLEAQLLMRRYEGFIK